MRKFIYIYIIAMVAIGCNNGATINGDGITVTIEPLKYFVDRITANSLEVNVVVPYGASPETHEITPSNMRRFENSELFISIGTLESEYNILQRAKENNKNIKNLELKDYVVSRIEAHECNNADHDHSHSHSHEEFDPHIWTSPRECRNSIKAICEALVELNPKDSALYRENYAELDNDIVELDRYITEKFVGKEGAQFIIYHPAFGYYAHDYSLEQIAIERDGKESSIKYIKDIVDKGSDSSIDMIFYQSQFESSTVDAICQEIGARAVEINPLKYNWLDNMYAITDAIYESIK